MSRERYGRAGLHHISRGWHGDSLLVAMETGEDAGPGWLAQVCSPACLVPVCGLQMQWPQCGIPIPCGANADQEQMKDSTCLEKLCALVQM